MTITIIIIIIIIIIINVFLDQTTGGILKKQWKINF